jgi:hypothetical protein
VGAQMARGTASPVTQQLSNRASRWLARGGGIASQLLGLQWEF